MPNNFQAGKVKQNVDKWKTITHDKSILDAINGYQLNFHTLPPTRNDCNNPAFNEHEKTTIALEVQFFFQRKILLKQQCHAIINCYTHFYQNEKNTEHTV